MAELILSIPAFSLTSVYYGAQFANMDDLYYHTPTTGAVNKIIDLSTIPYGSTINGAVLKVEATTGYSGGTLKINGITDREQDITDQIQPNSVGNYVSITIPFTYQAYGNMGGKGMHYSYCQISSAEIVIDYVSGEGAAVDEEAYRAASLAIAREVSPRAVITYPSGAQQPIPPDQIISFSVNEGIKSGVLLGAVSSSVLELRLANDLGQWLPGGSMRGTRTPLGAKISMSVGLKIDGEWMYQPAGVFTIEKFSGKATEPSVTLQGYDDMSTTMEGKYIDGLTYPQMLSAILTHISEQAGIPFTGNLAANGDVSIPSKPDWGDNCTLRQALSFVCQAGASYGQITRSGFLGIFPTWRQDQKLSINPHNYMESTHDERKLVFNRISIIPFDNGEEIQSVIDTAVGETKANTVTIEKNPLFLSSQSSSKTMADGIRDAMDGASWRAADFRWRGDPSVTIGCRVMITERSGEAAESTIMNQAMKWDQGFSMTGKCEIDIGRAFADLGYDETAIGGLPAGSKIQITESSGVAWYTIVDSDYGGAVLILRDEISGTQQYYISTPGSISASKYSGSNLDIGMENFYTGLPEETRSIIAPASVPVRSDASNGASGDTLERHVFAMSAVELGLSGSALEGESAEYLGTVANGSVYWTREPLGGMAGYAYSVDASGNRRSDAMNTARGFRPAFCVYKNTAVKTVEGGFAPVT